MTDGEMAREYNTAKDKKTQIRILSELTLKPEEEIIRILKENGCEVEEKRRGRKPKAEEKKADIKTAGSPRKRRSSGALKEAKRSGAEEPIQNGSAALPESSGPENIAGETIQFSSDRETAQSSSSNQTTQSSSGIPEGVRIALKKEAEYASDMIRVCREKMEECYKTVREIFEYADAVGISEKDLMR